MSDWKGREEAFCGDKEGSREEQSQWKTFKHLLSDWAVAFGHGGADHLIRGIFHSAGYASSHASHQPQGPCVRDGCRRSSLLGPKHEAASSHRLNVFLQARPDLDNVVAFI